MQTKRTDNGILMSSTLVCENYGNWAHAMEREFERVGDNKYKCKGCGSIMVFKEPVLTLDDKGRLKMQVEAEPLPRERGRDVMPATSGTPLSPYRNDPDRNPPTIFKEDKFA